jgi:hypothetical protein
MADLLVVVETGKQKAFASALEWPGWSRAGKKTGDNAIAALLDYRDRFAAVLDTTGVVTLPGGTLQIKVVEEQAGDGQTDFGVPGQVAASEHTPITGKELERQIAVLEAGWTFFDQVSASVSAELRKGPRGGGRDRDPIIDHVLQAERGYVRYLGLKRIELSINDAGAIAAHREEVVASLRELGPETGLEGGKWPVRYVIRRMAWHVLDHAWEMQDKDLSGENA